VEEEEEQKKGAKTRRMRRRAHWVQRAPQQKGTKHHERMKRMNEDVRKNESP
jgi:hypothetical protein